MQYVRIDIWPAAIALGIGVTLSLLLHLAARVARRLVTARTRRELRRALEDFETKANE